MLSPLSFGQKLQITLQRYMSFICYIVSYPIAQLIFHVFFRQKIVALQEFRKKFFSIKKQIQGPVIICANHLTLIDPFIIAVALGSWLDYLLGNMTPIWNFPKGTYVYKKRIFRWLFFIFKTIPVQTPPGKKNTKRLLQIITYLLKRQEPILLFPEGTRSINGRIDKTNFSSGVGYLLRQVENTSVICVYLRGQAQTVRSKFPAKGDRFFCDLKLIKPQLISTAETPTNVHLTEQVIATLYDMEQNYFNGNKERLALPLS